MGLLLADHPHACGENGGDGVRSTSHGPSPRVWGERISRGVPETRRTIPTRVGITQMHNEKTLTTDYRTIPTRVGQTRPKTGGKIVVTARTIPTRVGRTTTGEPEAYRVHRTIPTRVGKPPSPCRGPA